MQPARRNSGPADPSVVDRPARAGDHFGDSPAEPQAVPETTDSMPDHLLARLSACRRPATAALGVLALACVVPPAARAQWPLPSAGLPVCTAAGAQTYRMAISDGAGGMFVGWSDTRFVVADVYAQHTSAAGVNLWTHDGVLVSGAAGRQDQAVISSDGAGGLYVAWRDTRLDAEGDIYMQHLDPNGVSLWAYNGIPVCTAPGQQTLPVLAPDTTGASPCGVVVAWEDYRAQPSVYAQRLDPLGNALWTPDGVRVSQGFAAQYEPSMVPGGSTGTLVAWSQQGTTGYDIWAQELGHSGETLWGPAGVALCTVDGNQFHPQAVSDSAGGAWVVWEDDRGTSLAVYAERVTSYGMPVIGGGGLSICPVSADQLAPTAVADVRGGVVVGWQDARVNSEIYAQRIDPTGARLWPATGMPVCTAVGTHAFPSVAADGRGGAILAWEDDRTASGTDIYAQRLDSLGVAWWTPDGVGVCTATASQFQATVVSDPDTFGVVVWTDLRGNSDLYCNRVPWALAAPRTVAFLGAAPNPARDAASFAFALAAAGRAELAIFDAAGRRVRTLAHQVLDAGAHRLPWDARDDSGRACAEGVYFARLTVDGRTFATNRITLRR